MRTFFLILLAVLLFIACTDNNSISDSEETVRGSISGCITSVSGLPLSGVDISTDSAGYNAVSDTNGEYSIPDVAEGNYTLTYTLNGFYDTTTKVSLVKSQIVTDVNMALRADNGVITGKIVGDSSIGLSGVSVTAFPGGENTTTGDSGYFEISGLIHDSYILSITYDNYSPYISDTIILDSDTFTIDSLIFLQMLYGAVEGVVTDDSSKGIAGVLISTIPSGFTTVTKDSGRYEFSKLPFGSYKLFFSKENFTSSESDSFVIDNDSVPTIVNSRVVEILGSITGSVIDDSGKVLSGVSVTTDPGGYNTNTISNGSFTLKDISLGDYQLNFSHNGYASRVSDTIKLDTASKSSAVNVVMQKIRGSITGIIVDDSGRGLEGVSIVSEPLGFTTGTDSFGAYALSLGELGKYRLRFYLDKYETSYSDSITLTDDSNVAVISDTMSIRYGTVLGTVKDDSGSVLSGVSVTLSPGGYTTVSDTAGNYSITSVPVDTYSVTFIKPLHRDTVFSSLPVTMDSVDVMLDMEMVKILGTISGTVRDKSGNRLKGVAVAVTPVGKSTVTDAFGEYTISGLPVDDTLSIGFSKINFKDSTVNNFIISLGSKDTVLNSMLDIKVTYAERDVYGTLTGDLSDSAIGNITVTLKGDSVSSDTGITSNLQWDDSSSTFSGFIMRPEQGLNWTVEIRVYNDAGRVTGYKKAAFDTLTGDIFIPTFSAQNACPLVIITPAKADTVFFAGDTIKIPFTITDIDSDGAISKIDSLFIKGESDVAFIPCDSGIATFIVPDVDDQGYSIEIRARDNEGNYGVGFASYQFNVWSKLFRPVGATEEDSIISIYQIVDDGVLFLRNFGDSSYYKSQIVKINKQREVAAYLAWDSLYFHQMIELNDGNFVAAGRKIGGSNEVVVTKVTPDASIIWEKSFVGAVSLGYVALAEAANGELLVTTYTSNSGGTNIYRLNNVGDSLALNVIEEPARGMTKKILPLPDGSFILAGSSEGFPGKYVITAGWVCRLNSDLDTIWVKSYDYHEENYINDLKLLSDGNVGITGCGEAFNSNDNLMFVTKIDVDGNEIWNKQINGKTVTTRYLRGMTLTDNGSGGIVVAGYRKATDYKTSIILTNYSSGSGAPLWEREFSSDKSYQAASISATSGGGYLLGGYMGISWDVISVGGKESFVLKVDSEGKTSILINDQ